MSTTAETLLLSYLTGFKSTAPRALRFTESVLTVGRNEMLSFGVRSGPLVRKMRPDFGSKMGTVPPG